MPLRLVEVEVCAGCFYVNLTQVLVSGEERTSTKKILPPDLSWTEMEEERMGDESRGKQGGRDWEERRKGKLWSACGMNK